ALYPCTKDSYWRLAYLSCTKGYFQPAPDPSIKDSYWRHPLWLWERKFQRRANWPKAVFQGFYAIDLYVSRMTLLSFECQPPPFSLLAGISLDALSRAASFPSSMAT